jgi:hypothetical protein
VAATLRELHQCRVGWRLGGILHTRAQTLVRHRAYGASKLN